MTAHLKAVVVIGGLILAAVPVGAQANVIQVGLIVDASSSTEGELPAFRAGVAAGIGSLTTDGTVELTLTQFSAEALVLVDALLIDSVADRDFAVAQANGIDPNLTAIEPFTGGTNIEDGIEETVAAMTASTRFGDADLQWINILTDANPTSHNQLGMDDIVEETRKARARQFALDARNDAITAGIDNISFEILDPPADPAAGIPYAQTLAHPLPFFTVTGDPPVFPDPIESQGFILELPGVDDIASALQAKFAAAEIPEPTTATLTLLGLAGLAVFRRRR